MEKKEILDTSIAIECKEGTISVFTVIEHPPSIDKFEKSIHKLSADGMPECRPSQNKSPIM